MRQRELDVWRSIALGTRGPLDRLQSDFDGLGDVAETPGCCFIFCWHQPMRAPIRAALDDFRAAERETTVGRLTLMEATAGGGCDGCLSPPAESSDAEGDSADDDSDSDSAREVASVGTSESAASRLRNKCRLVVSEAALKGLIDRLLVNVPRDRKRKLDVLCEG
jgi:hypothetical protein